MTNLRRRLRKLESGLTDGNGLVPHFSAWFAHWERKIDQVITGDDPDDLRGIPLEVVDAIIEAGTREATAT
jgi:hypothetical protein